MLFDGHRPLHCRLADGEGRRSVSKGSDGGRAHAVVRKTRFDKINDATAMIIVVATVHRMRKRRGRPNRFCSPPAPRCRRRARRGPMETFTTTTVTTVVVVVVVTVVREGCAPETRNTHGTTTRNTRTYHWTGRVVKRRPPPSSYVCECATV